MVLFQLQSIMEDGNTTKVILHPLPLCTLRIVKAVSRRFRHLVRLLIQTPSWRDQNQDVRIAQWAEQSFSTQKLQASVLTQDTFEVVDPETAIRNTTTRAALGPSSEWLCIAAVAHHLAVASRPAKDLVLHVQPSSDPFAAVAPLATGPLYGDEANEWTWNMIAWVTPEMFVMAGGAGEGGGILRLYDRREGWLCDAQGDDWCAQDQQDAHESNWPFAHSGEIHKCVASTDGQRVATASSQWTSCGNPHMDTLKVWDVREAAKEGGAQLIEMATVYRDDDEAQVSDMAVCGGMLATIWRNGSVRLYNICDSVDPLACTFCLQVSYLDQGRRTDPNTQGDGLVALSGRLLAFMITSWSSMSPDEYDDYELHQCQLEVEHIHMLHLSPQPDGYTSSASASAIRSVPASQLTGLLPAEPLESRSHWYDTVYTKCSWLGLCEEQLALRNTDTAELHLHTVHHHGQH